ncbi:hypothetical protein ACLS0M_10290 [Avibacterium avium]|uniref:hypothetical protein n=1 Tax=Avibacterium avium TaxID=751 RepID=UPI003BF7731E
MINLFKLMFRSFRSRPLYVTENLQKYFFWRKPIKPYAFIRVHNEIKTIDGCLHSILDCVKGGVIGYHSCTDGTKEYILDFCKKYPQFSAIEYPFNVIPADDIRYKNDELDEKICLDAYYNFVWDKLPRNEWIVKIDADHIYVPEYLKMLCQLPLRKKEIVFLNRINLHYQDNQIFINKERPFYEEGDHWIIFNNGNLYFKLDRGWNKDKFFAWESLVFRRKYIIFGILCNYHFPIIKNQRNKFNEDEWILFDEFDFSQYMNDNKLIGRVPNKMLDKNFILGNIKKFNL